MCLSHTWPWQAVFEWSNPTEENASISLGKVHTQTCNTKGSVASPRKLDWLWNHFQGLTLKFNEEQWWDQERSSTSKCTRNARVDFRGIAWDVVTVSANTGIITSAGCLISFGDCQSLTYNSVNSPSGAPTPQPPLKSVSSLHVYKSVLNYTISL